MAEKAKRHCLHDRDVGPNELGEMTPLIRAQLGWFVQLGENVFTHQEAAFEFGIVWGGRKLVGDEGDPARLREFTL